MPRGDSPFVIRKVRTGSLSISTQNDYQLLVPLLTVKLHVFISHPKSGQEGSVDGSQEGFLQPSLHIETWNFCQGLNSPQK